MPPELHNKLVAIGNQVMLGTMSLEEANRSVAGDEALSNLTDEQLWPLIEEAERYWRDKLDVAVKHPKNLAVYAMLNTTCAESRLRAIAQLREGAGAAASPALDQRMAQWITHTARCQLAHGLAFLLLPDYERAFEMFSRAESALRTLPAMGRSALRVLMGVTYGQAFAAQMLHQQAMQQMKRILSAPEHQQEIQAHFSEIKQEFIAFQSVVEQREQLLDQQSSAGQPPPEAPKSYMLHYRDLLNSYLQGILSGQIQLDEAKQRLLEEIDFSELHAGMIVTSAHQHLKLAGSAPQKAVVLAELNHAVASVFTGDQAEHARYVCTRTLGLALTDRAGQNNNDPEDFRRAIPYLEEAVESHESSQDAAQMGHLLNRLAICYRGVDDFEKALQTNLKALEQWKTLGDPARLATAYGNLADVQEQFGDSVSAFGNHYQAFKLYYGAKDLRLAQKALHYLSRLSMRVGRSDEAISALEKMADLKLEVADLEGAVVSYLSLGENRFRVGQFKEALEALQRAEELLRPAVSVAQPQEKYLSLYIDALIWRGTVLTLLFKYLPSEYPAELASRELDEAVARSMEVRDARRFARAILQSANFFRLAGKDDLAESQLVKLSLVEVPPAVEAHGDEILGTIRVGQHRYPEAIALLQKALQTYPPEQADRRMATLDALGQAYEGAGQLDEAMKSYEAALGVFEKLRLGLYEESRMQFMGTARELYERLILLCATKAADPIRALYWLEKSKSRTFSETMGLALLPLRNLPDAVRADWQAEQELLDRINDIRSQLFARAKGVYDSLAAQKALHETLQQLNAHWDRMEPHCGEYVALRRGNVINWDLLQKLLAASPPAQ